MIFYFIYLFVHTFHLLQYLFLFMLFDHGIHMHFICEFPHTSQKSNKNSRQELIPLRIDREIQCRV
jgi:hypothetical protein